MATRSKIKVERVARLIIVAGVAVVAVILVFAGYKLVNYLLTEFQSTGEAVKVPAVIGMTEEAAAAALQAQGLIAEISRSHNDTQPAGCVFQQDPSSRTKAKPGRKIKLFVSLGQATFIVPDLINRDISTVPEALRESGLFFGAITKIFRPDLTDGQVVNQNPKPGHELSSSAPVDLVVVDNKNLTLVEMPEVVGSELFSVEDRLAQLNLHLVKVTHLADDSVKGGTVLTQSITAGEFVSIGSPVELTVALPTEVAEKPVKTVTIYVSIPDGPVEQRVRIKVFDALGANVSYDTVHAPGNLVEEGLSIEGEATIFIFINDMNNPYRKEYI